MTKNTGCLVKKKKKERERDKKQLNEEWLHQVKHDLMAQKKRRKNGSFSLHEPLHPSSTHRCTFQSAPERGTSRNRGWIRVSVSLSCTSTGATRTCRVRRGARRTRSARWTRTSRTSLTRSRGELHCALLLSGDMQQRKWHTKTRDQLN